MIPHARALLLLGLVSGALAVRLGFKVRRRARDERGLREAAVALAGAVELDDVLRQIVVSAVRHNRGESAYIERLDRERGDVVIAATAGSRPPAPGTRLPYADSLGAQVIGWAGEPKIVNDIAAHDTPAARLLLECCGPSAAIVVPLVSDQMAEGALVILRPAEEPFREDDLLQPRILGVLAALALRRAVLLDEVRESEARFRAMFETSGIGIALVDQGEHAVASNAVLQRMLDYRGDELRRMRFAEYTHPDDVATDVALFRELVAGRRDHYELEKRFIRRDGRTIWGHLTVTLIRSAEGAPRYVLGMVEDVTARKRAEHRLRAHVRQRAAIAEFGQRALASDDVDRLVGEATAMIAEQLGVEYSAVLELLPGGEALIVRAGVGWREGTVGGATVPTGRASLAGYTLLTENAVVIEDLRKDTRFGPTKILLDHGVVSGMTVIIRGRDRPWGILSAHTKQRRRFGRDDVAFLESAASILGQAVERRRVEAELRESERNFRTLADNIPQFAWMADAGGWIFWYNQRWYDYTGTTPDEVRGWGWTKVHHPDHVDRVVDKIRRAFETGDPWEDTFPLRSRSGEYRWFLSRALPIRDARGNVIRWFGTNTDITDQLEAEAVRERLLEAERAARGEAERRAREEAALRDATAAVSAAFTVEDTTRRIAQSALIATQADGAYVERIDADADDVAVVAVAGEIVPPVGWSTAYPGSNAELVIERNEPAVVPRLAESERPIPDELKRTCGDCSAAVIPLVNAGEPVGSLTLLRGADRQEFRPDELRRAFTFGDLAALAFRRIHLFEESERRREELLRVTDSRSRLMRGFSHDVKNPLGSADGYLELLEAGVKGELVLEQRKAVSAARRAIRSALGLIEDLLAFARAEAGEIEIRRAPTDVREAAREIAEEYRARAEMAGLSLDVELPDDLPLIRSDPTRIRQVLSNLLSNAVKYTSEGGIRIRVEVRTDAQAPTPGEWVTVAVEDTGPGVPPERLDLLFREFTRLEPEEARGAGVGLAISQRVAQALGGVITVDSRPGEGSTFMLWLPLESGGESGAAA